MATEIKCEKKVIREIFNMWYCIPDYQRAYVWDTDQVRDLLDNPKLAKKCVKSLMIPTTAGTGAEATPNAIVAVPEKELKVGIVNDKKPAKKDCSFNRYRCHGACH